MKTINNITSDSKQKMTVILDDGSKFIMSLEFKPQQFGWFITELSYGSFTVRNIRVVTSPNILRQFKNLIPFGLCCLVSDNQEPTTQTDFSTGRATMSVVPKIEVLSYEAYLSGEISA